MFFIFLIAILNLAFGFALAMYLGGHYCMIRKFGVKIPFPAKAALPQVGNLTTVSTTETKAHPPAAKDNLPK